MAKNFDFDDDFMDVPVDENRSGASERIRKADKKKKSGKGKAAVGLILAVILVIAGVVGGKYYLNQGGKIPYISDLLNRDSEETPAETPEETPAASEEAQEGVVLSKDSDAAILTAVKNYYAARVSGDADTLSTILAEGSTLNTDELTSEREFIEDYQDISTYVTDGMQDGEKAVYVSYSMKFKNINTAAPGLEPMYTRTDAEGNIRLLFYNDFDSDLKSFMKTVSSSPAVVDLSTKVRESYLMAQDNDADLKNFLDALAGEAQQETTAETTAADPAVQETPAETTAAETTAASGEITFKEVDDIQYTTTQVKCRKKPSLEDTDDFQLIEGGVWVHVIGISEKWSKVGTQDGYVGYIYNDYLTPDKPETAE